MTPIEDMTEEQKKQYIIEFTKQDKKLKEQMAKSEKEWKERQKRIENNIETKVETYLWNIVDSDMVKRRDTKTKVTFTVTPSEDHYSELDDADIEELLKEFPKHVSIKQIPRPMDCYGDFTTKVIVEVDN